MGDKSDEYFETFLIDMAPIAQKVKEEPDKLYKQIAVLMFSFLDVNHDGDLVKGGYTYASHAQGFFTFFKKYDEIKEYFEAEYQKNHLMMQQVFEAYSEAKQNGTMFYTIPQESVTKMKRGIKPHILSHEIYFSDYQSDDPAINGLLYKSRFHKNLYHTIDFEDIEFQMKRFVTICQYYFFKNLGLTYEKRCFLCYSIYRYMEETYNINYENAQEIGRM